MVVVPTLNPHRTLNPSAAAGTFDRPSLVVESGLRGYMGASR